MAYSIKNQHQSIQISNFEGTSKMEKKKKKKKKNYNVNSDFCDRDKKAFKMKLEILNRAD